MGHGFLRRGRIVSAKLERPSGFAVLDDEALALVTRAQPLPPPPPEVAGDPLVMIVPVDFVVR
ncbi:MAG: TonB family protein [Rhodospirillaceae bacterium]|nr:TonB family protein [Rhodospirillaceae bacterium]